METQTFISDRKVNPLPNRIQSISIGHRFARRKQLPPQRTRTKARKRDGLSHGASEPAQRPCASLSFGFLVPPGTVRLSRCWEDGHKQGWGNPVGNHLKSWISGGMGRSSSHWQQLPGPLVRRGGGGVYTAEKQRRLSGFLYILAHGDGEGVTRPLASSQKVPRNGCFWSHREECEGGEWGSLRGRSDVGDRACSWR